MQFIREMSVACRNKGLVLSVDNYVPSSYTAFYNRKEQGIVADYVIVMDMTNTMREEKPAPYPLFPM